MNPCCVLFVDGVTLLLLLLKKWLRCTTYKVNRIDCSNVSVLHASKLIDIKNSYHGTCFDEDILFGGDTFSVSRLSFVSFWLRPSYRHHIVKIRSMMSWSGSFARLTFWMAFRRCLRWIIIGPSFVFDGDDSWDNSTSRFRIAITCGFVTLVYFAIHDVKKWLCVFTEMAFPILVVLLEGWKEGWKTWFDLPFGNVLLFMCVSSML